MDPQEQTLGPLEVEAPPTEDNLALAASAPATDDEMLHDTTEPGSPLVVYDDFVYDAEVDPSAGSASAEDGLLMQDGSCRARRSAINHVSLEKPQLYEHHPLIITTAEGFEDLSRLVPKCAGCLEGSAAGGRCIISRHARYKRHGIYHTPFPLCVTGVLRLKCSTHKNTFSILHPKVVENFPEGARMEPSLVVLTESTIMTEAMYNCIVGLLHKFPADASATAEAVRHELATEFSNRLGKMAIYVKQEEEEATQAAFGALIGQWSQQQQDLHPTQLNFGETIVDGAAVDTVDPLALLEDVSNMELGEEVPNLAFCGIADSPLHVSFGRLLCRLKLKG